MATEENALHPVERAIVEDFHRRLAIAETRIQQLEAVPSAVGDCAGVGRWRQLAKDEAVAYTMLAIDALPKAEGAIGGEAVQKARELLEAEPPSSRNAALALMQIGAHDEGGQDKNNNPTLNDLSLIHI